MKSRVVLIGSALIALVVCAGGFYLLDSRADYVDADEPAAADQPFLPIPPVPPRIAEGADYEKCLGMLSNDPAGAAAFAEAWEATGGGDGATQCLGLSKVALGSPQDGAQILERLAGDGHGAPAARATIYAQATQAWLMAGDTASAYATATMALSLSPDDPDLLLDHAVAAGGLEHYAEVVDDLTRALAADPERNDALVLRGAAYRHLDQLDRAQDDVDRALTADPDDPEALLERGILRQRRGDAAGARADWERAIAVSPDGAAADLAQQNLSLLEAGPARQ